MDTPRVDTSRPYTTAWCDGSSTGAWGPGGWGWHADNGQEGHGGDPWTTNQRMELVAAHQAMLALPGLLLIVSDSQYVVLGVNERRRVKANRDLWLPFIADLQARRGQVRFAWVKGHAGNVGNERADQLAKAGKLEAAAAPPLPTQGAAH